MLPIGGRATPRTRSVTAAKCGELSAHQTLAAKVLHDCGNGRKQTMAADDQVCVTGLLEGGADSRSTTAAAVRSHELDVGDQRRRGRSAAHRRRGPGQIFEMTVRGGRARSPRSSSYRCQTRIGGRRRKPGPFHQLRPRRMRVRRAIAKNPFLPDIRRRGHPPSHAGGDRDGRGNRSASNAEAATFCSPSGAGTCWNGA